MTECRVEDLQVLVIEDELLIAHSIIDALEDQGICRIRHAASEGEALKESRDFLPDLIISDVDLNLGGCGPVAVEQIRAACGKTIPVVFVSATPPEISPEMCCTRALKKPFHLPRFWHLAQEIVPALEQAELT